MPNHPRRKPFQTYLKRVPGAPQLWQPHPQNAGIWRLRLADLCRRKGYVHVKGARAGKINVYRLSVETGLSYDYLRHLIMGERLFGLRVLGRLCDVLACQPNDLLLRVRSAGHGPQRIEEDDYFLPDDLPDPDES